MSYIEIRQSSGESERRKLSKSQPLSVGAHASNDVRVEGVSIGLLHCRIAWNKSAFEVVAAGASGIEVNGTLVQHAVLQPGDVIRIGDVDIEFVGDREAVGSRAGRAVTAKKLSSEEIGVAPNTDEVKEAEDKAARESTRSKKRPDNPKKYSTRAETAAPRETPDAQDPAYRDDISDDLEVLQADIDENFFQDEPAKKSKSREKSKSRSASKPPLSDEFEVSDKKSPATPPTKKVRPGEQDALRAPIVHIMLYGAAALLLLAAIFWFWIGRDKSNALYESATGAMKSGQYAGAIELFEQFIREFSRDPRAKDAVVNLGKCRILSYLKSSSPNWEKAQLSVDEFITENRSGENFSDLHAELVEYGGQIGEGAANTALASKAEVPKRQELVGIANEGLDLVKRYGSLEDPPVALIEKIDSAIKSANADILKQETFEGAVGNVSQAIDAGNPMSALEGRRELLNRYPDFENNRKVMELLEKILASEKAAVQSEELVREALRDERTPAPFGGLNLAPRSRARTDATSEGRVVIALSKDCCYGIDSVTGDPLWRRVIGLDTPFFPVGANASSPSIMLFDTNYQELVSVERATGKLVWRQPLQEGVSGQPLIEGGQLFVATLGQNVFRIDAGTGRISARLHFSQKLLSPPVLEADRSRLIVAGDREVFYTLSIRPFECLAVTYVGHSAGSLKAPLLTMGRLLLAVINERAESSELRVFDTRNDNGQLAENTAARTQMEGVVRDQPTLRGNQLFVTASGQRIFSFTVSDEPNQAPLTAGAKFQGQSPHGGPTYLMAGPENQLWMSSDALRKLQVAPTVITEEPKKVAVGVTSQPLQLIGRYIYVGRREPYCDAVIFSQSDRDQMTSQWRTVLGPKVLTLTTPDPATALCVTEDGSVFSVTAAELHKNGFKSASTSRVDLTEIPNSPLVAASLPSGRVAICTSGNLPKLWIVGPRGQIEPKGNLPAAVQTKPIEIAEGLVLPLPGKLKLLSLGGGAKPAQDFVAPIVEGKTTRWTQLATLDRSQFIGINDAGLLARFQYRPEPVPHLEAAQSVQLEKPVDVPIDVQGGRIYAADSSGKLMMLDASTLDPVASVTLESPANSSPYLVDGHVYVSTARHGLLCYEAGDELKKLWSVPMENVALKDAPMLVNGKLVVALSTGDVLALAPADGSVAGKLSLGQPLLSGPKRVGDVLAVSTIDGTLRSVESVLQAPAP